MKKGMKVLIFGLILIIFSIAIKTYLVEEDNKEVIAYSDELYLIIEENEIENENSVKMKNGTIYFSYDTVKKHIDENLFYDENEELLIYTDKTRVVRYTLDNTVATINNKEILIDYPIEKIDNRIYLPMDMIEMYYPVDIKHYPETNAVVLDYTNIEYLTGEIILEDAVLRNDLNKKSFIIEDNLELGSVLNIYAEYENWYKVRTIEGIPGFIEKQFIKVNYSKNLFKVEKQDNIEVVENNPMLSLTWDYFNRKTTSANINNIKYISGLNVVSPTWFDIVDLDGNIKDKGNIDYVNKYNEMGSDVWPLITNDFNPDLTHDILSNSTKREKLINDILKLYISYGVQGINIDFENVHLKTKDYLTQFVRELYPVFNEANMKVSIDVTGISTSTNWSMCYDRTRLGEVVDYMMLMAYDQHWASSPVAGSVAEYYWVENTIAKVLSQVPNEKLILGIPFYTRLWITKDGKLTSQALSMSTANTFIDENNIELIWDETAQQYYGELEKNNSLYRIWVEDENSIAKKISLVHKYNLAGIASWRKGFETENIWGSMDKTLN